MTRVLILLLWLVCLPAGATTYYFSDCGTGAASACVAGDDSRSAATASNSATPWQTCAKLASQFASLAAGDTIAFARGSAQIDCTTSFLNNANATAGSPITITAYTPAWTYTDCTYATANTDCTYPLINSLTTHTPIWVGQTGSNSSQRYGPVIKHLHFKGPGNNTANGLRIGVNTDNVEISDNEIEAFGGSCILIDNNNTQTILSGDGISSYINIKNNWLHDCLDGGFFGGADYLLMQGNIVYNNGVDASQDHNLYFGSTQINSVEVPQKQLHVLGNTLYNNTGHSSSTQCEAVALIVHGNHADLRIENNLVYESSAPTNANKTLCWGIATDAGQYPNRIEGYSKIAIRNNTVINYNLGIGLDMCDTCLVEGNNVYSTYSNPQAGIKMRDSLTPIRATGCGSYCDDTIPTALTVRSNTVYFTDPGASSKAIVVSAVAADAPTYTGTGYKIYSNLIYFGTGSTSATSCFDTSNIAVADIAGADYNVCWFAGTTGKWDNARSTLAADQAVGLNLHSKGIAAGSCNVSSCNPNITTPSGPNYYACPAPTSAAIDAGHPTLSSGFALGGKVRTGTPDAGACEYNASALYPNAPDWLH